MKPGTPVRCTSVTWAKRPLHNDPLFPVQGAPATIVPNIQGDLAAWIPLSSRYVGFEYIERPCVDPVEVWAFRPHSKAWSVRE